MQAVRHTPIWLLKQQGSQLLRPNNLRAMAQGDALELAISVCFGRGHPACV